MRSGGSAARVGAGPRALARSARGRSPRSEHVLGQLYVRSGQRAEVRELDVREGARVERELALAPDEQRERVNMPAT